jgi:hypothetical protein
VRDKAAERASVPFGHEWVEPAARLPLATSAIVSRNASPLQSGDQQRKQGVTYI